MTFKTLLSLLLCSLFALLIACTDSENENNLVDLHIAASEDIISIALLTDVNETIFSVGSEYDFTLQGTKSNGVDVITLSNHIEWSLSDGANSRIDNTGHFTAAETVELITLTAKFGHLSESIDIKVSDAKFDKVVKLSKTPVTIDMCRSQPLTPVGRYVDSNDVEEIRQVDSIIINTIEWIVREQSDNSLSNRAHIETASNQATLRALAAGNLIFQAKASSIYSGSVVTSDDFSQSINNGLTGIKLCSNSDTDLNSCNVTSAKVEQDKTLSLISVGTYQASDGSSFKENISGNSKWGINNPVNATITLPPGHQQIDITGKTEGTTATVSVACGDITQSLDGIDISQGVTLDTTVSCVNNIDCSTASASIDIDLLTVTSLEVTANDTDLTDGEKLTLDSRPDEITLIVTAYFSNDSSAIITDDINVSYTIITGDTDVIEEKAGSPGVYTVNGNGSAEIDISFRGETFKVLIEVP